MNTKKNKNNEISLSPEVLKGWNRYCNYHNMTHDEAIKGIVEDWDRSNVLKAAASNADVRGELDNL